MSGIKVGLQACWMRTDSRPNRAIGVHTVEQSGTVSVNLQVIGSEGATSG
jgi:hypothetical protein